MLGTVDGLCPNLPESEGGRDFWDRGGEGKGARGGGGDVLVPKWERGTFPLRRLAPPSRRLKKARVVC